MRHGRGRPDLRLGTPSHVLAGRLERVLDASAQGCACAVGRPGAGRADLQDHVASPAVTDDVHDDPRRMVRVDGDLRWQELHSDAVARVVMVPEVVEPNLRSDRGETAPRRRSASAPSPGSSHRSGPKLNPLDGKRTPASRTAASVSLISGPTVTTWGYTLVNQPTVRTMS